MAKILSRTTAAGSFALVTSGGSTSTYSTLPSTGKPSFWRA
jgi:hypothetical protein